MAARQGGSEPARRHVALVRVGLWLKRQQYRFTAVTPATHGRVYARGQTWPASLRDVFGWNRPFHADVLPRDIVLQLLDADALTTLDGEAQLFISKVRYASLYDDLFVHSAWPTTAQDSVFFGPDTYRFVAFVQRRLAALAQRPACLVDVGCGSGVAGIVMARRLGPATLVQLLDINTRAVDFARINVELAGLVNVEVLHSDLLEAASADADVVICNPPYLPDAAQRAYRDGGGELGTGLALRLVQQCLTRMQQRPMQLWLYTGAPVITGQDRLLQQLQLLLDARHHRWQYEEIDCDVFGEELESPAMAEVERIAAVGFSVQPANGAET